ncbi:hypothetical protein SE17_06840 [Kouleothrix aurantiaca]|uniref:Uncharacterized protein n=1 Tax=Kouleothrix aurantiaca TaxID=186479 RepID=A0A0P9DUZ1_9CHLR|nr:hypothetical protein SE17_06840 [Kouleothrix aurantiaca]
MYKTANTRDLRRGWIDDNTTLGVVLGVGTVIGLARVGMDERSWHTVRNAFVAAGVPMVVRKFIK